MQFFNFDFDFYFYLRITGKAAFSHGGKRALSILSCSSISVLFEVDGLKGTFLFKMGIWKANE